MCFYVAVGYHISRNNHIAVFSYSVTQTPPLFCATILFSFSVFFSSSLCLLIINYSFIRRLKYKKKKCYDEWLVWILKKGILKLQFISCDLLCKREIFVYYIQKYFSFTLHITTNKYKDVGDHSRKLYCTLRVCFGAKSFY